MDFWTEQKLLNSSEVKLMRGSHVTTFSRQIERLWFKMPTLCQQQFPISRNVLTVQFDYVLCCN